MEIAVTEPCRTPTTASRAEPSAEATVIVETTSTPSPQAVTSGARIAAARRGEPVPGSQLASTSAEST